MDRDGGPDRRLKYSVGRGFDVPQSFFVDIASPFPYDCGSPCSAAKSRVTRYVVDQTLGPFIELATVCEVEVEELVTVWRLGILIFEAHVHAPSANSWPCFCRRGLTVRQ